MTYGCANRTKVYVIPAGRVEVSSFSVLLLFFIFFVLLPLRRPRGECYCLLPSIKLFTKVVSASTFACRVRLREIDGHEREKMAGVDPKKVVVISATQYDSSGKKEGKRSHSNRGLMRGRTDRGRFCTLGAEFTRATNLTTTFVSVG